MCLHVNADTKIKVAKEDIVCYKVIIEDFESDGMCIWRSPYQGMIYEKGHVYILGEQLKLLQSSHKKYPYRIEEGFHSFTNLSDALVFLNSFEAECISMGMNFKSIIVKCTIPKGTTYVEGLFYSCGTRFHSFCSEKIVCEGKVENE